MVCLFVCLYFGLSDFAFIGGESDGESACFMYLREVVEKQERKNSAKIDHGNERKIFL